MGCQFFNSEKFFPGHVKAKGTSKGFLDPLVTWGQKKNFFKPLEYWVGFKIPRLK